MMSCCPAAAAEFLSLSLRHSNKSLLSNGGNSVPGHWNWDSNCINNGDGITISISISRKKKTKLRRLEAYKRIPMDTAGAYRLVDDQTGDKFIVLGGATDDDADASVPSPEQLLSWKPSTSQQSMPQQPQGPSSSSLSTTICYFMPNYSLVMMTQEQ